MSYIQESLSAPPSRRGADPSPNSLKFNASRLITHKLAQARLGGGGPHEQAASLLQLATGLDGSGSPPQRRTGLRPSNAASPKGRTPLVMHIRVRPSLPTSYTDAGLVPTIARADEVLVSALNSFSHFLDTSGADQVGNPPSTDPMHYSFYVQRPALLRPSLVAGAKAIAKRLDAAYVQGKPYTTNNGRPASPFRHGTREPAMVVPSALRERGEDEDDQRYDGALESIATAISCVISESPSDAAGGRRESTSDLPVAVESAGSTSEEDNDDAGNNHRLPSRRHSGGQRRRHSSLISDNAGPISALSTSNLPSRRQSERKSPEMSLEFPVTVSDLGNHFGDDFGSASRSDRTSGVDLLMNAPIGATKQRPKRAEIAILEEDYEECGPDNAVCQFAITQASAHLDQIRAMRQTLEMEGYNSRKVMRLCEFMLRDAAALSVDARDLVRRWDPSARSPWEDDADNPILDHDDEIRNVRTPLHGRGDPTVAMYDVPAPTVPSSKGGLLPGNDLTDAGRARQLMQARQIEARQRREQASEDNKVLEVFVMLRKPFILSEQLVFREVKTRAAVQFVWEQSWKSLRLYEQLWFSRSLAAQQFREGNTEMQRKALANETKCRQKIASNEAGARAAAVEAFYHRYRELEFGMTAQFHHIRTLRERHRSELDSGVAKMYGGTNPYTKPVEEALELLERHRRQTATRSSDR